MPPQTVFGYESHEPTSMPAFAFDGHQQQQQQRGQRRQRPTQSSVAPQPGDSFGASQQMRRSSSSSKLQSFAKRRHQATTAAMESTNTHNPQQDNASLPSLDGAGYDELRNMTLMFFFEKLCVDSSSESGEPKRLHDLSCMFGSKGFTREMRQVVGSSRTSLKKFLQSCPSLFTVDGDKVYITKLKMADGEAPRNYSREAVDYFCDKLLQFGASLVPLKNLFGYRSQASQQVRHISGQNVDEFRAFLAKHSDEFELTADGEYVVLKSMFADASKSVAASVTTIATAASLLPTADGTNTNNGNSNSGSISDPYLNKQFARVVEKTLREMLVKLPDVSTDNVDATDEGKTSKHDEDSKENNSATTINDSDKNRKKVPISELHAQVLAECKTKLLAAIANTEKQFKTFLRMHPKIFKRLDAGNSVSLVTDDERRELENNPYAQISLSAPRTSGVVAETTSSSQTTTTSSASGPQKTANKAHQTASTTIQAQPQSPKKQTPGGSPSQISQTATTNLRATAPPFVPSSYVPTSTSTATANGNQHQMRRSVSTWTPVKAHRLPIDSKAAIRNYLTSNNNNVGHHHHHKAVATNNNNNMANGYFSLEQHQHNHPHENDAADLRARTLTVVCEASNVVSRIMTSTSAVTFDCLGSNLGSNGQITIFVLCFWLEKIETIEEKLGLATANATIDSIATTKATTTSEEKANKKPEAWIFDLLLNPELAYCLKPLLECEQIVKVVHDVRNKSNALYNQFGIMLNNVFDTQVANLVIQQQETGKPAYKSRYISTSKLVELYGNDKLIKQRNLIKAKTRHQGSSTSAGGGGQAKSSSKDIYYWRIRPLTSPMLHEAIMVAYCLAILYDNLKQKIQVEYEPLLKQLNLEGVLARIKPEEIKSVRKERKIDLEVIDLKRKLYDESNCFIVLSNKEIRLLRHIDLTAEVRAKIQQSKKVAKKLERLDQKAAQMMQPQSLNGDGSSVSSASSSVSSSSTSSSSSQKSAAATLDSDGAGNGDTSNVSTTHQGSNTSLTSTEHDEQLELSKNLSQSYSSNKAQPANDDDEINHMSLMDSSMFDALRDTMLEPTNLLESLKDDDDDVKNIIGDDTNSGGDRNGSGTASISNSNDLRRTSSYKLDDSANSSLKSTKPVDMAIQCDLIS